MSTRRTRSNSVAGLSQPPEQADAVMGPPPIPGPAPAAANNNTATVAGPSGAANVTQGAKDKPKDDKEKEEIAEKYKKLKRKYHELEEKYNEANLELQRSGERNTKFREERNVLIDRTIQLENQLGMRTVGPNPSEDTEPFGPHPPSSAFSYKFLSDRSRQAFEANLQEAAAESAAEDFTSDPAQTSNHVGASARRREQERKERQEEEAKEAKKTVKKGKGKAKETSSSATPNQDASVVVSSTGTRLRIKPPAPPDDNQDQHSHPPSPTESMAVDAPPETSATAISGIGDNPVDTSAPITLSPSHSFREAPPNPDPNIDPSLMSLAQSTAIAHVASLKRDDPNAYVASSPVPSRNGSVVGSPSPSLHHIYPSRPTMINTTGLVSTTPLGTPTNPYSRLSVPPGTPYMVPYTGSSFPYAHLSPGGSASSGSPLLPPVYSPTLGYMSPIQGAMSLPHHPQQPSASQSQSKSSPEHTHGKAKRQKAHTVVTKTYNIPIVPRDRTGAPMLPLNVGIMTVISLGKVCMRDHFHTERYIFPVGYEVTRRYLSTIDPKAEVIYHCTILDGGDGPKFQIVPADTPDKPILAGTATGAWSSIVKQANTIRNRQHSNSVSGPDFFGLGQNTIKHLIQQLPNADKLKDYVWQNFVEGGPLGGRHAAVIPALPEEYDSHLPIGAYYPSPVEKDTTGHSSPDGRSHYPEHSRYQSPGLQALQTRHKLRTQSQSPGFQNAGSPSPTPSIIGSGHHARSPSVQSDVSSQPQPNSPSLSSKNVTPVPSTLNGSVAMSVASSNSTSSSVPPTFASIMNAYPAPAIIVGEQSVS